MQEPALDFIVFIVILGLVTALSFGLIIPVVKDSKNIVYTEQYDKTVQRAQGEMAKSNYDGCLSIDEIALQVMGQSYFMPEPRVIDLADNSRKILESEGFSPSTKNIGVSSYNYLLNWANNFRTKGKTELNNKLIMYNKEYIESALPEIQEIRFRIQFDYNEPESISDDTYSLFVMLECKDINTGEITKELFRCLSGGNITRR